MPRLGAAPGMGGGGQVGRLYQNPQPEVGIAELDPIQVERRLHLLNSARQHVIVQETEKLQRLAEVLNYQISQENTGTWSPAELRTLTEIEHLARDIREKMIHAVGNTPRFIGSPDRHIP